MIPKKIYLSKKELQDILTGERMVSIDEPYNDLTEEYTNLSQLWHYPSEEPKEEEFILVEVVNTLTPKNEIGYYAEYSKKWIVNSMKAEGFKCRWAYIKDLLPKFLLTEIENNK